MRRRLLFLALLAVACYALGRSRTSFNVDVLDLLPPQLPEVAGLKLFRAFTSGQNELIVTLELPPGAQPSELDDLTASLAERFRSEPDLTSSVAVEPFWQSAEELLGEWSAYLWLNGDPAKVRELENRLQPAALESRLTASLDTLALSFDAAEVSLLAYDPAGFIPTDLAGSNQSHFGRGGSWFRSADGLFHALYLEPSRSLADYRESAQWVSQVASAIEEWKRGLPDPGRAATGLTGEPAFAAEIAKGMERDMKATLLPAMAGIALLFWLFYRRWRPLSLLVFSLALTFTFTFGIGGLLFGSLSVMSVGFAAILIGLAVDYGVVTYQESLTSGAAAPALRRKIGPSVFWAAITTAAVFSSLNLSILPGVRQLGSLVALGILIGAAVMLGFFLPAVAANPAAAAPPPSPAPGSPPPRRARSCRFLPPVATAVLLGVAVLVLIVRDLPQFQRDFSVLRPRHSPAGETLAHLQERLVPGGDGEKQLPILVHADSEPGLLDALEAAEQWIHMQKQAGTIRSAWLPAFLWPNQNQQEENRPALVRLARQRDRILQAFSEAGFEDEGHRLARIALESWDKSAAQPLPVAWPEGPASQALTRRLARRGPGDNLLLGIVEPAGPQTIPPQPQIPGVFLTGWPSLGPAVVPLIERDIVRVFLPIALVLAAVLAAIFRNGREVLLAVATMAFSALLLLAAMAALHMDWNLMNLSAIPLLLGTGIDYVIHMIFALRRCGGDPQVIHSGIRRALVFCCLSTSAGFASLSLASNQGLSALGQVCSLGILASMLSAALLLPWWWRVLLQRTAA
ncbi:MAG TPA: MMPL family transporter [Verrucomicrobiales bacterium]|nr:MMPL family transporter [Verrucomicrobiales bacterium]